MSFVIVTLHTHTHTHTHTHAPAHPRLPHMRMHKCSHTQSLWERHREERERQGSKGEKDRMCKGRGGEDRGVVVMFPLQTTAPSLSQHTERNITAPKGSTSACVVTTTVCELCVCVCSRRFHILAWPKTKKMTLLNYQWTCLSITLCPAVLCD